MYKVSELDLKFLSSLMKYPSLVGSLPKEVVPDDFDDQVYYDIYSAIMDFLVNNKTASYSDLKFKFRDNGLLLEIIAKMEQCDPLSDINDVYEQMGESYRRKTLYTLGEQISREVIVSPTKDVIKNIEVALMSLVVKSGVRIKDTREIGNNFLQNLSYKVEQFSKHSSINDVIDMSTGIIELDLITMGIGKKNTWVIGGGTSDGKTQLAVQIANNVINSGKKVLYFMLEDSSENLLTRLVSLRTAIPISSLMTGNVNSKQLDKVKQTIEMLKQSGGLLVEEEVNNINEIVTLSQFAKLKNPELDLIIVDHINLIADTSSKIGNREQEIGMASKKLVSLAKKMDVAVMILQQLNTNPDSRSTGLPVTLNDLRDCKSTSHDSAVTVLINCPHKYDEEFKFSKKFTQLIVAKNRYGEVNRFVNLTSKASIGKFEEGMPDICKK